MEDITIRLLKIMETDKCSSLRAFYAVQKEEDNGFHILQSKPSEQAGRRLCHSSSGKTDK